jgi:hypothetical protein
VHHHTKKGEENQRGLAALMSLRGWRRRPKQSVPSGIGERACVRLPACLPSFLRAGRLRRCPSTPSRYTRSRSGALLAMTGWGNGMIARPMPWEWDYSNWQTADEIISLNLENMASRIARQLNPHLKWRRLAATFRYIHLFVLATSEHKNDYSAIHRKTRQNLPPVSGLIQVSSAIVLTLQCRLPPTDTCGRQEQTPDAGSNEILALRRP